MLKTVIEHYVKTWISLFLLQTYLNSGVATVFAACSGRKICPLPPLAVDNSLTSKFQKALKIFIFMELQSRI